MEVISRKTGKMYSDQSMTTHFHKQEYCHLNSQQIWVKWEKNFVNLSMYYILCT